MGCHRFLRRALMGLMACALLAPGAAAAQGFVVEDIEIEGLRRGSAGQAFSGLSVQVGDYFNPDDAPEVMGELYRSGLFEDIVLRHDGGKLIFVVQERPGIAAIVIEGNEIIPDDALTEGLQEINIAIGRIYDRATFERLREELKQQYYAIGKYGVQVRMGALEAPDNQVNLEIVIDEGRTAIVRDVRITGNRRVSEEVIREDFETGGKSWYEFWSSKDQYSKFKLEGDLERINNTYLDRGFLDFRVEETRVTLTPDKRSIDVLIKVSEGRRYRIRDVNLTGMEVPDRGALQKMVGGIKNTTFSRKTTLALSDAITRHLKDRGYAFARVNVIPETRPGDSTVDLAFFVSPGKRAYVRRIDIQGNETTDDEVFRREMRQLEGAAYSARNVELSRRRLQRLPYVSEVTIEEKPVAESGDLLDLDFSVSERLSGNFNIGAGYSDSEGGVLSVSLAQDNFLGSGNRINFAFNNSDSSSRYAIGFLDPYYTIDGISRAWNLSYREVDYGSNRLNVTAADTDELNLSLNYGVPISESDTLGFGLRFQDIQLSVPCNNNRADTDLCRFVDDFIDGRRQDVGEYDYVLEFTNYILSTNLVYDTRDRSLFTTEGARIRGSVDLFGPGGGLSYVKLNYSHGHYFPLGEARNFIFAPRGVLSYASAYGDTSEVPFYDRYYAGGTRSLRGYQNNSVGPRDPADPDDAIGGNFRLLGNFDLFFPSAAIYDPSRLRMSLFTDIGDVTEDIGDFSFGDMKGAFGLNVHWLTAIGAVTFNLASHFNDESGDDTESFQFDFGTNF